jgi:hypothetical protein
MWGILMGTLSIPKFFSDEAKTLRKARENCIAIHHSDIRAAGNEVEIAVRKWLERMLPDVVSVGHGHIIDQESNISPQLDCILRDSRHLPTLFTAADGTEFTPFDSVYAVGEIKSTYYKSSKDIQDFSDKLKAVDSNLKRNMVENTAYGGIKDDSLLHHILLGSPEPYLNQLFTFMLFVDSGDATTDEIAEIYRATQGDYLPDIAVFLNGCIVIKAAMENNVMKLYRYHKQAPADVTWKIIPAPNIENSTATPEGIHLGFLYYCLLNHIRGSHLEGPNPTAYLKDLLVGSKSTVIPIDPGQSNAGQAR